MKQILRYSLVALMAMVFGNVMADEVTLKYSGSTTTNMKADGSNEAASVGLDENEWSVVADKGKASNAPGLNKAGDIRLYWNTDGSNTITVKSLTNATISTIAITFTGDAYNNASVTVDGNAVTGSNGVYNINSTSFVLGNANTSNAQVRISQIVITYSGGTPVSVLPPKFSVEGGMYFEPQTVALSCDTEGAKILYTIPAGQDPEYTDDENVTGVWYDGNPLTISQTTTIKAMAVKDGKTSSIVEATYTIVELEETSVAKAIEIINALENGAKTEDMYKVKGFVVGAPDFQRNGEGALYGNVNLTIADEKGGTTTLTIYRAKSFKNENFTEETTSLINEGDEVVFLGKLQKYVKDEVVTPELTNGYLFSVTPAPKDIELVLSEGCDISTALDAALAGANAKSITVSLSDATYTLSKSITTGVELSIIGNNATIDVSSLESPVITLAEPTSEGWTEIPAIFVSGIQVKGLKNALFYSGYKNYHIGKFYFLNNVVEAAADVTVFDFTKGSVAEFFGIDNSTFWAPTATSKSFYSSQGGQKATEYGSITQTFMFFNNTFYNFAKGKNFFSHRQSNQKWLAYEVQNNIFVNCGKSGQVIKGMNGGQAGANPTWTIKGNAFNFDGADTSATESTGDDAEPVQDSVAGVIAFTDAANGDFNGTFTLAEGATKPEALGDGRWTITYTTATGISNVETVKDQNSTIYNIAGQMVTSSYKGLVIKNGKKFVNK